MINKMEIKDILLLIFSSIFVGFTALFIAMDKMILAIIYLLGNAFIIYLLAYFAFKYKHKN